MVGLKRERAPALSPECIKRQENMKKRIPEIYYILIFCIIIFLFIICALVPAYAQDETAGAPGEPSGARTQSDEIFAEILGNLPAEVKAEVDSAKQAAVRERAAASSAGEQLQLQREKAIEELPEELRRQVEKAIGTIESEKLQRKMEFMEQNRRRDGEK
jgi:hypothetical protein